MSPPRQAEWTVSIETFEGLTASVDVLERFADALDANPMARGPAASLETERGILSATFQVEAHSQGRAAELGIGVFYAALGASGFDVDRPGWKLKLEIEPLVEEEEPVPA